MCCLTKSKKICFRGIVYEKGVTDGFIKSGREDLGMWRGGNNIKYWND